MTLPVAEEQRREAEIAALEKRITDVFTGMSVADGVGADMICDLYTAIYCRFTDALEKVFGLDPLDPRNGDQGQTYPLRHYNAEHMKTPRSLAEWYHKQGVRA